MEPSMDDKLYYVESPDGQVLGPMNMIHILEGIAAGMILESARICEVGRQEWITLSEVAYTREEDEEPAALESAPFEPSPEPSPGTGGFAETETLAISGDEAPLDEPFSREPSSAEIEVEGPFESAPSGIDREPDMHPPDRPTPLSEPAFPSESAELAVPAEIHEYTPPEEVDPAATSAIWDSSQETHEMPIARPAEQLPAPVDGGGDFALAIPVEEAAPPPTSEEEEAGATRRKWAIPVTIAVAVPILAGVWFMLGEKIPFLEGTGSTPPQVATPAADDLPEASLKRAWALLSSGNKDEALAQFRRAVVEQPDNPEAHHGLGRAALALNKPNLAAKHLERAANLDPTQLSFLIDLGQAQLLADEPGLAEKTARHVLSESPEEAKAHLLLGHALAALDDPAGAAKELGKYLEAEPADDDARRRLAHAFARTGQLAPAIVQIERYLSSHAEDTESQSALLGWMLEGRQAARAGQRYGALANNNPESAFHQYLAGLAHPNSEEGARFLQRAIELEPSHGDAHATLGRYQAKLGRRDEAMASLKRAFEIRPGSAEERALLADFQKAGAPATAETKVAAVEPKPAKAESAKPKAAPGGVGPWVDEIREALDAANFRTARSLVESARANLAGDRAAGHNLDLWSAVIDFEEGAFEKALATLETLDPDISYAASGFGKGAVRNWIARTHMAMGDTRAAVGVLDQIGTEDADEYANARLWEGVVLSSLGMTDLADRTWNRIATDVGRRVGPEGRAAMKSAQFLAGSLSEKDYRTAVKPLKNFENDMHFFLGHAARLGKANELARSHFAKSMKASHGHEFPFHLARAEVEGD